MRHFVGNRGYEPIRGQRLEPGAPPDVKEGFRIGRELPRDDPRVVAREWNCGWNLWPDDLPELREALEAYYNEMIPLARRVVRGLALAPELPEERFNSFCQEETATLRVLR